MSNGKVAPRRGDFIKIYLDGRGHEQGGYRPAVVLSATDFNRVTGRCLVAPVTSTVRGWSFEVPIPHGHGVEGVVLVDQVRAIDWKARGTRIAGAAPAELLEQVSQILAAIVEFDPTALSVQV